MAYDDDLFGGGSDPFTVPSYNPSTWGSGSPVTYPQQDPQTPQSPSGGADDDYVRRLIQIESGGNPTAVTGSNRGLGQFSPDLEKKYNITDWKDPDQQVSAIRAHAADNAAVFKTKFDRDPTPGELYLMHQQGAAGGPALIANPDQPAWRAIRPYYKSDRVAQEAIYGNIPKGNPLGDRQPDQISAGEFSNLWTSRFPSQSGAPTTRMGAGLADARPTPSAPPSAPAQRSGGGFFNRLAHNPMFFAGVSALGTAPGGNWGPNASRAAAETTNSQIAAEEHYNTVQQRAQRQQIWNQSLFPNGEPNMSHPLLKNAPPEIVQAAAASGPDEGLPLLQKYALSSGEQQLQMRLFAQRAQLVQEQLARMRQARQAGQQPQPAPSPAAGTPPPTATPPGPQATPQNPPAMPPAAMPGVSMPPAPGPGVLPGSPPGAPPSTPEPSMRPQPSPGFIPPGMPARVPGLASRNTDIGASVFDDPNIEEAILVDQLLGDKTGRGASNIINQALTRAQQPEIAGKSAYMTARGKAEGERQAANTQMQIPLAMMDHLQDIVQHTPAKILNAATGPYMGDHEAQARRSLVWMGTDADRVYNLNTEMHHIVETITKQMKGIGGTDQDQAIAGRAMGMFLNIKNDPQKMLEVINDAKNMIKAAGGEMPQYLVSKYAPSTNNIPTISGNDDYAKLQSGMQYRDPMGNIRTKR